METEIIAIYPKDVMKPNEITEYEFRYGSIAGCVGNEINERKKPGINEDGAMIIANDDKILSLIIDGHYSRDSTILMLDRFKTMMEMNLPKINIGEDDASFLKTCNKFSKLALAALQDRNTVGEASFMISLIDFKRNRVLLYSVGDIMLFIHDPKRQWGPYYQLGQRHYYEWINNIGVAGYHFHSIEYNPSMEVIITTDGLIDDSVIRMGQIAILFKINKTKKLTMAGNLVKYALEEQDFDDNITTIYIKSRK